tara:strand:- start:42 stop:431 length:390 start_codon:yes stop_codon:yes gene_type:complete
MYLLDTDVIVDFLREKPGSKAKIQKLMKKGIMTTSFSFYEILLGAVLSNRAKKNMEVVASVFSSLDIQSFSPMDAVTASQIAAKHKKQGNWPGIVDTFIAAVAVTNDKTIVTNNEKHFVGVDGLKIKPW